ncbi:hypothetical protein AQZ50_13345 [Novosphingobium sp. Fuku2-ISO-50]|jgi:hypothetical protein|nr:hypothetical protein AQZ50_13345 [Novosphingobium sp. Fuku2-ISO-50]
MEALTQCWYTRMHRPERARHRESDGSVTSTCRYCRRPLVSWDRVNWSLSNGLDVSHLAEITSGRTLTLIDTLDDLIIRRFPVRHLGSEAEVDALKQELRAEYALDEPGSTLVLRDSAQPRGRRRAKAPPDLPPGITPNVTDLPSDPA